MAGVSLATVSRVINGDRRRRATTSRRGQRRGRPARLPPATSRRATLRRADGAVGQHRPDPRGRLEPVLRPPCTAASRTSPARAACSPSPAAPTRTPSASASWPRRSRRRGVDGLIIVPGARRSQLPAARARRPASALVFVDRPPRFIDADAVRPTTRAAPRRGDRAPDRAPATGGSPSSATVREPVHGGRATARATARRSPPTDSRSTRSSSAPQSHEARGHAPELLAGPTRPTALFTAQNLITIEAVRALHDLGLPARGRARRLRRRAAGRRRRAGLTVVAQNPFALGRTAASSCSPASTRGRPVAPGRPADAADRARLGRAAPPHS